MGHIRVLRGVDARYVSFDGVAPRFGKGQAARRTALSESDLGRTGPGLRISLSLPCNGAGSVV